MTVRDDTSPGLENLEAERGAAGVPFLQLVLDLTRPEVYGYLLERIGGLLAEYEISYVKWDCNRDIVDAGSGVRAGAPAAHDQALAVYALLDELRARHPGWSGSRARPTAAGSTWASCSGCSGSGPRT